MSNKELLRLANTLQMCTVKATLLELLERVEKLENKVVVNNTKGHKNTHEQPKQPTQD